MAEQNPAVYCDVSHEIYASCALSTLLPQSPCPCLVILLFPLRFLRRSLEFSPIHCIATKEKLRDPTALLPFRVVDPFSMPMLHL